MTSAATITTMTTTFLLIFLTLQTTTISSSKHDRPTEMLQTARDMILEANNWAKKQYELSSTLKQTISIIHDLNITTSRSSSNDYTDHHIQRFNDCAKLYDQAEPRLSRLLTTDDHDMSDEDAVTWLSAVVTNHMTCLDGLKERGVDVMEPHQYFAGNLSAVLDQTLRFYARRRGARSPSKSKGGTGKQRSSKSATFTGVLSSWDPRTSRADTIVAQDGSGDYRTIKDAVSALSSKRSEGNRAIVYIKAGIYNEKVEIKRNIKNVMFVGDGIDRTVITGHRNYIDGGTTLNSATVEVAGDGFWARDMTFENTAGPQKHQAVAIMVSSDHSIFYHCSFKGYQDTLYVHSLRQFYRDCQIYGTIDFIFGNAAVIFQNCDILVRKPMDSQRNMITAQGRDSPYQNTGISIHECRIISSRELAKGRIKSYLGRPWKKYSRVIVSETDMDGFIDPKGWTEWDGSFALSTLFYGEYRNFGSGADTSGRVRWPGFHVLRDSRDVAPFMVKSFIQGDEWILGTGVPVKLDV